MKKHIYTAFCLLSMLVAGCNNDDMMEIGNNSATETNVSLNARIGNVATRLSLNDCGKEVGIKMNWSDEDQFMLYQGTDNTGYVFSKSKPGNSFTGSVPMNGAGSYHAFYGNDLSYADGKVAVDITNQTGVTSAEQKFSTFMVGEVADLNTTITFNYKMSFLKLMLSFPIEQAGKKVDKVTIKGLHRTATYVLSSDSYENFGNGDIYVTNGDEGFTIDSQGKVTVYVSVFPEKVDANSVLISASVGSDNFMYWLKNGMAKLPMGKVVAVNTHLEPWLVYDRNSYVMWEEGKDWASHEQAQMYLAAGVYWDNGTSGENWQTYSISGSLYHSGLWMKKKEYIEGFDSNTAPKTENKTPVQGRPSAEEIHKYFFLPAAGVWMNLYSGWDFWGCASYGRYWTSSIDLDWDEPWVLYFDKDTVGFDTDKELYLWYGYFNRIPLTVQ